jgi:hypothetical protein
MSNPPASTGVLLTWIAILALAADLIFGPSGVVRFAQPGGWAGALASSPGAWIGLMAPAFFLWALWSASNAIGHAGRGAAFNPAMLRALRNSGGSLMLGSWAAIVAQPSLIFLIGSGSREWRGVRFNLDVETSPLALVGLALILLAREGPAPTSQLGAFV